MFRRKGGMFYARDTATMSKESLGTKDREQASRLVAAKNQAQEQPALNKGMAKVYLAAASPEFALRTWTDVMEKYVTSGAESSKDRKERAFRSRPYVGLHKLKLIDTAAEHLFAVLEHKKAGNSTHHYLRRLHNFALHLGWLLAPVMAEAAWPAVHSKKFCAVTEDEHLRIIEKETNLERRLYYQMLWETGGSQSDIAHLSWDRIDRDNEVIQFQRQKLAHRGSGGMTCMRIGPRLQGVLDQLPRKGDLFPKIITEEDLSETLRTFSGREGVLGSMGVYRAAFTSIEQTEPLARLLVGHKVPVPVVALGGEKGLGKNVERMLKLVAKNVEGEVISKCGHFLPEEYPEVVVRHILALAAKHTSNDRSGVAMSNV